MTDQLTLDGLLALCERATPGPYTAHDGTFDGEVSHPGGHLLLTSAHNVQYFAALSPEVVAALVRAVQNGKILRAISGAEFDATCTCGACKSQRDFDAAIAALDAAMRGKE